MSSALLLCAGGGIGDSLLASLCATALKHRFDTVDAFTLPGHVDTLRHVPDIDHILADDGARVRGVAAMLSARRYDAAVVTWATQRTAAVVFRAGIPIRVGQSRRLYSGMFTHRIDVRSETGDVTTHWSQILLDYARALGCDTDAVPPRFTIAQDDRTAAAALLGELGIGAEYAIVHPWCAATSKRPVWPLAAWRELIENVRSRYGYEILISGTAQEANDAQTLAADSRVHSIAGKTSIGAFAEVARRAQAFIVMHSGPMHVAAAVGTPTIAIFPLQADFPDRWRPLGERVRVVRASYPCRPGERMETCPDYLCIQHLPVVRILAALKTLAGEPNEAVRA